jgi:hypothetical protein
MSVLRLGLAVLIVGAITVLASQLRPSHAGGGARMPLTNSQALAVDPAIRTVATRFILSAVARTDTAASWELLDPTYPGKSGFTKGTWAKGRIPVIQPSFPVTKAGIQLAVSERTPRNVLLEVLLTNRGKGQAFELGLKRHRGKAGPQWLVDRWIVRYVHTGPAEQ